MASSVIRQRVRRTRMPRPSLRRSFKYGKLQSSKVVRNFLDIRERALLEGEEGLFTALCDVVFQWPDQR